MPDLTSPRHIPTLPNVSVRKRWREGLESALCSRWLTTWRMGEDAPYLPFAIPVGIGSVGWKQTFGIIAFGLPARPLRVMIAGVCLKSCDDGVYFVS